MEEEDLVAATAFIISEFNDEEMLQGFELKRVPAAIISAAVTQHAALDPCNCDHVYDVEAIAELIRIDHPEYMLTTEEKWSSQYGNFECKHRQPL